LTFNVYKIIHNFKKEYKYTLGEKLKLICHDLLDLIVIINSSKDKLEHIKKLNIKLETLRIHLRLAFDLKVVSAGQLGEINRQIDEIGRQIGGWQKWAANSH
jgi:hypothetical protein